MYINKRGAENLIADYERYIKSRVADRTRINERLKSEKKRLKQEALEKLDEELRAAHDKKYRPEFEKLSSQLTTLLNDAEKTIMEKREKSKPDDYEARLANTLSMLKVIDSNQVNEEFTTHLAERVKPFTNDPIARSAITNLLAEKAPMATVMLFNDAVNNVLENINQARAFVKNYDDMSIGHNLTQFFNRNFDLGLEPQEPQNIEFSFD